MMKRANSGRSRVRMMKRGGPSSSEALTERRKRLEAMTAPLPTVDVTETLVKCSVVVEAVRSAVLAAYPDEAPEGEDPAAAAAQAPGAAGASACECYHESLRGPRPQNEDHYVAMETCNRLLGLDAERCGRHVGFFGIYDGHNGQHAATVSRQLLHHHVVRQERFPEDLDSAIFDGFVHTDRVVNEFQSRRQFSNGTTAISVFVFDRSELVVGNTGDSRGVLARAGGAEAVELAVPHGPDREDEKERLKEAGAAVVWFGTWRVNGVLAVSRSIGDCELRSAVVADPDVTRFTLKPDDRFMILATDGLWDVMGLDESVKFVMSLEADKGRPAVAHELCEEALRRGSKDNVSVIVVFFS
eukprot:TRINITY_DN2174_c0_g1_i1.p2 TRINITY_DN2174_c0_g1~~TRINITY_DN2174_c0_g1_i1.p2  ORF type:complete len:357 (-),score=149.19 TRINITY_DN2174_c0_g1_i1:386-1456(-)